MNDEFGTEFARHGCRFTESQAAQDEQSPPTPSRRATKLGGSAHRGTRRRGAKADVEHRERLIRQYGLYSQQLNYVAYTDDDAELNFRVYYDIEGSHLTIHGVELYRTDDRRPTVQQRSLNESELERQLDERGEAWDDITSFIWDRHWNG